MKILRRVLLAWALIYLVATFAWHRPELFVEILISVTLLVGSEIEHP